WFFVPVPRLQPGTGLVRSSKPRPPCSQRRTSSTTIGWQCVPERRARSRRRYPLLTVHLPHHGYGATPLTQTSSLRGRVIPALFLELTYHLEHHLYPSAPSHHLPELACRL